MIYLPEYFEMTDVADVHGIIERFPLATLMTQGPGGIAANHIPLMLDCREGPHGTLIGHVARKNAMWEPGNHQGEALAVFQGSEAYISPNWYPSKQEAHEVVPTWNYAVVHAYGPIVVHEDAKWLRGAVGMLTRKMERITSERPWKMADAPRDYIAGMLENIVGIEIPITRIIGKMKASQNRTSADQIGAVSGLRATDAPGDRAMAEEMNRVNDLGGDRP